MHQSPELGFVVIEGHATDAEDEGANFVLAEARARLVWQVMLAEGVAYERLAYRAAGAMRPLAGVIGDPAWAEFEPHRRVEFHIERRLEIDEVPAYPERQYLPWSGEVVDVVEPTIVVEEDEEPGEFDEFDEFEDLEG